MSTLDLELKRVVRRAPAAVWSYVVEGFFANHSKWDPAIVEMRKLTGGEVGEGTRGVEVRRFAGKQETEFVVTEFRPPSRFALHNKSRPFALERTYDFRLVDGHTELCFRFIMTPKGAMTLLFPILRRVIAKQIEANIDRLCDLLNAER